MKHLILYADYKHGNESEVLRIELDASFDNNNKKALFKYLSGYIKKYFYDLSYVASDSPGNNTKEYVFSIQEFNLMLQRAGNDSYGYALGSDVGSYLFPIGIRCLIKKTQTIKLSNISKSK